MKPGSLAVPIIDYGTINDPNFSCEPFYPNPNTICTVKNIIDDGLGIEVEETTPFYQGILSILIGEKDKIPVGFAIKYWREIQPPEENTANEIVKDIIEESLTQPV